MQPINPNQEKPDCGCLHDLFHFTFNPEASTLKKVLLAIGYTLFHISTLGIPLLIHYGWKHELCRPGDGINTLSRADQPSRQTVDDAIRSARNGQNAPGAGAQEVQPPDLAPQVVHGQPEDQEQPEPIVPQVVHGQPEDQEQPEPIVPQVVHGQPEDQEQPEPVVPQVVHGQPEVQGQPGAIALGSLETLRRGFVLLPTEVRDILDLQSKVGYPRNATTYFSHECGSLIPVQTDSPGEIERKAIVKSQIQHLDKNYYILPIAGDGFCFFRSVATAWLLSLANKYSNDPECFANAALELSTLSQDFVVKCPDLCHQMYHLVANIPQIISSRPVTPRAVFEELISNSKLMNNIAVAFFAEFSLFLAEATMEDSGRDLSMATVLIGSLTEDATNLRRAIQTACLEPENQDIFLQNIEEFIPTDLPSALTIFRWLLTQTYSDPTLRVSFTEFEKMLQLDFTPEEDFEPAATQLITLINDNPLLAKLWTDYSDDHPSTRTFIKLYGFLEMHGSHVTLLQRKLVSDNIKAFTRCVEAALRQPMADSFNNYQAVGWPGAYTKLLEFAQASMRGTLLFRSWIQRPEIILTNPWIRKILEDCLLQISQRATLENIEQEYQEALQQLSMYPEERRAFQDFLLSPCIEQLKHRQVIRRHLLGVFLTSRPGLVKGFVENSALDQFWCRWNNEMDTTLSQLNFTDLRKDLNIGFTSAFISDLPEHGDHPHQKSKLGFLTRLVRILECQPELIGKQVVATSLINRYGKLNIVEGDQAKTNEAVQAALATLEKICPGAYGSFITRLQVFLPPKFFAEVTSSYLIHLFLISEQTNPALILGMLPQELITFATDYPTRLQARLATEILPGVSEQVIRITETRIRDSYHTSRLLFNQCLKNSLFFDQVCARFLQNIPFSSLQKIYRESINQAEAEHVMCLSARLKEIAICDLLLIQSHGLSLEQLRLAHASQGFIMTEGFESEDAASIHLLRMNNHYCALVPKEK
ncbi:MAG: hypothetical protein RR927_01165 [Victivallaceae bacterium]